MNEKIIISGGEGQHGNDLLKKRKIFNGIQISRRAQESKIQVHQGAHAIIVPITNTQELIQEIMDLGQAQNIINFSGIMSTTPEEIRGNLGVENLHFLFGPSSTIDLKACLVYNALDLSTITLKIVNNSKKIGIQIIETNRETHDRNMAIIQGFHHLVRKLISISGTILPIQAIETNEQTIRDMIKLNPFMEYILVELRGKLINPKCDILKAFSEIVENNISTQTVHDFGTPRFIEMLNFSRDCENEMFLSSEEILRNLNNFLH